MPVEDDVARVEAHALQEGGAGEVPQGLNVPEYVAVEESLPYLLQRCVHH